MKLSKERIIDSAFVLLNKEGLDCFNLRALAKLLAVSATALYWHFKDKDELIAAMALRIYDEAYAVLSDQDDLHLSLLAFGRALRSAFGVSRDTARLCATAKPFNRDSGVSKKTIAEPLERMGLSVETALNYEAVIIAYVLGWSVFDQNQSMNVYLEQMMDFEGSFEIGLCAMVRGFELPA